MKKATRWILPLAATLIICSCGEDTVSAPSDADDGDRYVVETDSDTGKKILRPETTRETVQRKVGEYTVEITEETVRETISNLNPWN
jgi:hypothetical protein